MTACRRSVAADGAKQEHGLAVGHLAVEVDGLAADAQIVAGGVDLGVLEDFLDGPVAALEHELLDVAGHADVDGDGAGALAEVDVAAHGAKQEHGLAVGHLAVEVDGLAADAQVVAGGVDLGVLEDFLDGPVAALEHELLDVAGHADVDGDGAGALAEVDVAAHGAKQEHGLAVGHLAVEVGGLAADAQVVSGGVDLGVLEGFLDGPVAALEHELLDVAGHADVDRNGARRGGRGQAVRGDSGGGDAGVAVLLEVRHDYSIELWRCRYRCRNGILPPGRI